MRIFSLSLLAALGPISFATHTLTSALALPSQLWTKAPRRTPLNPRTPPTTPLTWYATGTQTVIRVMPIRTITGVAVTNLLDAANDYITTHISLYQDSNIAGGSFEWTGANNLLLQIVNTNNHQVTWGVLGAAVEALGNFMRLWPPGKEAALGYAVYFTITDGGTQVGVGTLGN